ncbi:Pre-mRNA-splicing factor Cwf15/Cwc15 [Filobasidium floriforme]|uniref:Pre-mRNA-splicing factor Cwf15/Cwc15 n=1 Tax=Filobasidium floriforme TaxID=5210 RepID=UPI001E8D7197|nr:Pre-mRNA-splicing factor Cwf15/Cwc15 [Filobasidium floriforme]KAH8081418.1 Pre-mRNA-splicing factor Cwf15/Cwc15 [Filobasidium floriforme]
MSNAHRPTWTPAMGKETKAGSRSYFQQDYSARTKLKFRQPGQISQTDVQKRDLRAELLKAEREATDKKRKAAGLAPLPPVASDLLLTDGGASNGDDNGEEQASKRRKILEEAAQLDADDESDDEDADQSEKKKGKQRATDGQDEDMEGNGAAAAGNDDDEDDDDDDDSDDDSDDDEDETAALMAELNKIKQERAEEKARQEQEASESNRIDRETEIATGNPLLNLQAALGQMPSTPRSDAGTSTTGSFAVKRRWDDDLIFKNQAAGVDDKPKKEFVNDILRSEFHRKFMSKFVK